MSQAAFQSKDTAPKVRTHSVRIQGAGTSNPTNTVARGVTVTRTGSGTYRYTFGENPGVFQGAIFGLQVASTPADLVGYTVVAGPYNTSSYYVDVYIYNASDTLADLASTQFLNAQFKFKATGAEV